MTKLARHLMIVGGLATLVVVAASVIAPKAAHGAAPAAGQTRLSPGQCFRQSDVGNWVAPDPRTLYVRVAANRYYRIDLARQCSALRWLTARLITRSFGTGLICGPVDMNLRASEGGPGDIAEPCFVEAITPLSREEVAALPKGAKP